MSPDARPSYSQRVADALRDRYDVDRVLGRGGMSIVFLAHDRHLGRAVAIKVLDPEACSAVGAERFLREVRITAPLQHPNVLPLIDSGTVGDIVYSVMPYVEGESLRDRLVREGQLPVEEALLTAREVAEALDYAHKRGIVHRDIKPENILLSNGQAVVADFGIARASSLANELTLSGTGVPIGTPAYMSPEQVRGRDHVDARADVYSLGCTLYEMLAGRPPFDAPSVTEVLSMHLEQEPLPLARRRPELPDRVIEIVHRAMQKRAVDRYQSAGEMAAELRAALGEPPRHPTPTGATGERRSSLTPRPSPSLRPARASGWLVLGAIALALVALVLVSRGPEPTRGAAGASLAVLPFPAEPAGSIPDSVTEGLAREIHAGLTRYDGLRVAAAGSAIAMAGAGWLPGRIGDSLDVAHVLTGAVRVEAGGLRTTARLVRARDGATVWQRTWSGAPERLGIAAAEIAERVAAELLAGAPSAEPEARGTPAAAFTAAMLRGRYWLARSTPQAMASARDAFEAAVALDPGSAEALAGLSRAHSQTVVYSFHGQEDLYTELATAGELARRAMAADSTDPAAMMELARTTHFAGAPADSVAGLYAAALAAAPNQPEALLDLAHITGHQGLVDSTLMLARQAVALDPLSAPVRHGAITAALRVRRPDLAVEWARARLAQDPGDLIALALESYALPLAGRAAECVTREFGPWLAAQATCLHAAGRTSEAAAVADSLRQMLEREEYATAHQFTDLATYYAWTGQTAEALRWLERSAAHTPLLLDWVFTSGLYDRIGKDPKFTEGRARLERQVHDRLQARAGMVGQAQGAVSGGR
ncbi:MAG TPA: protein kinase [Gemmatimonadales bacterium]|nr:protein kinase [Gemmatimonadales bacterium]